MAKPVSVVIPAYNCQNTIRETLKALRRQTVAAEVEIIVVDDGSTDNTAREVRTLFHDVHYVYQDNAGPATARNRGARQAQGEILLFTDSDCVPHEQWVERILVGFEQNPVSVVAGSYGIANPESLLARCIHQEILFRHQRMPRQPKVFGSYNVGIKRQAFFDVNGFDETYRHASGEDNDLSYRLGKKGHQIYFDAQACVDHHHPVRMGRYLKEQFRHGFWRAKMMAAHQQLAAADDYTFWKDPFEVLWAAAIALCGLLSLLWHLWAWAILGFVFGLFIFEVFFALRMRFTFIESIYYGWVMFLRVFSRALGLSTGIFNNLYNNLYKKT